MIRPTDQDIIAIDKRICYTHKSQREGAHTTGDTWRSTGSVRRQRERGKPWARACTVVCMGRKRRDRVSSLRIA